MRLVKKTLPFLVALSLAAYAKEAEIENASPDAPVPFTLDRTDTFGGIDADHNGIRDDIDRVIKAKWPNKAYQHSIQQFARAVRKVLLLDSRSSADLVYGGQAVLDAIACMTEMEKHGFLSEKEADQIQVVILRLTNNTLRRAVVGHIFMQRLNFDRLNHSPVNTCEYR